MSRTAFLHTGSYFHLATLKGPAVVAMDIADVYAPDLTESGLDDFDAVYVAARLHPGVRAAIAPLIVDFLNRDGVRLYIDGGNAVGQWLPGTTEVRRGTNFWAWRIGEDVGRRSVNLQHPMWQWLSQRSVHWHYHGVLDHPAAAVPLVALEQLEDDTSQPSDPWGLEYRAIPGHPNTLMYYDDATFAAQLVVSSMDASYHHGAEFMPGASQLLYRMLGWLRG